MKRLSRIFAFLFSSLLLSTAAEPAATSAARMSRNQAKFQEYLQAETAALSGRCLADVRSLADWESRRTEYRRQLQEMLGLWPWPARTDLKPVITGRLEQADFTVEKLHFQASPGLYVTANLYLPRKLEGPAPAILYVCGHSRVVTNGVSCGNKAGYQHHGAWFARNGYVCLLIDTVQLGEIEGVHHGTYSEGKWWWNARGYTPAGVEAWFGIRALDYLCSRPEVDRDRIGMTGRSGGGSYTWTVAALDERVKVAAPVAGITDLQNQVVDGAVDGHCDCMFYLNAYRWDFPQVAALIAPRPLLIGNSDKDRIFPLDGVVRLYEKTKSIYQLYRQTNNLGLLITDGPHADTQDLQLPVFRWFNRFLKHDSGLIEMAAKKFFAPEQLRVFDKLPGDQINTKIQDLLVPQAATLSLAAGTERELEPSKLRDTLKSKVFAAWPNESTMPKPRLYGTAKEGSVRFEAYALEPQPGVELWLYVVRDVKVKKPQRVMLTVLDSESHTNSPDKAVWTGGCTAETWAGLRQRLESQKEALAFLVPRLVAPERWLTEKGKLTQVRRRFMLLGATLDSMRVWDIRCGARALRSLPEFKSTPLCLKASGPMGVNAAYAALFEPGIQAVQLDRLPHSHLEGPDYLNVLQVTDIPRVLALLGDRYPGKPLDRN